MTINSWVPWPWRLFQTTHYVFALEPHNLWVALQTLPHSKHHHENLVLWMIAKTVIYGERKVNIKIKLLSQVWQVLTTRKQSGMSGPLVQRYSWIANSLKNMTFNHREATYIRKTAMQFDKHAIQAEDFKDNQTSISFPHTLDFHR